MEGCSSRPRGEPGPPGLPDRSPGPRALPQMDLWAYSSHRPCTLTTKRGRWRLTSPSRSFPHLGHPWKSRGVGDTLPGPSPEPASAVHPCSNAPGDTTICRKKFTESKAGVQVSPPRRPFLPSKESKGPHFGPYSRASRCSWTRGQSRVPVTRPATADRVPSHSRAGAPHHCLSMADLLGSCPQPITCQGSAQASHAPHPGTHQTCRPTCHCPNILSRGRVQVCSPPPRLHPSNTSSWTEGTIGRVGF